LALPHIDGVESLLRGAEAGLRGAVSWHELAWRTWDIIGSAPAAGTASRNLKRSLKNMSDVRVRRHKGILWLILDGQPLNILSIEMLDQLTGALRASSKNRPRLIVITGAGDQAFCAGIDIQDHLNGREAEMLRAVHDNCAAFEELRAQHIPTVALVKGHALGGGCELAALCDTVIAHEHATFGLPEVKLGVFPPVAAAYFPSLIGYNSTLRLMLTGETLQAREAQRMGLAHQVLAARNFLTDAEELITMLATQTTAPAQP
jgi:enoyl-CoA hydratase/carnithine racemase